MWAFISQLSTHSHITACRIKLCTGRDYKKNGVKLNFLSSKFVEIVPHFFLHITRSFGIQCHYLSCHSLECKQAELPGLVACSLGKNLDVLVYAFLSIAKLGVVLPLE